MNTSVEEQIDNYLSCLTVSQKKAVLTVVKTIALAHQEYDNIWKDKSFKNEMDSRTREYENGTAKLYKFEDMKKAAIANYKGKSSRKK
ncbi:MAG: hypothetical protein ABIN97_02350 [Ginsengibacter sp.]